MSQTIPKGRPFLAICGACDRIHRIKRSVLADYVSCEGAQVFTFYPIVGEIPGNPSFPGRGYWFND